MQRWVIFEVKCNTNTWFALNPSQNKDKTMHVNGRAAAKVINSYQTSAVTLSSWGLFYRPAPWLCNIAAFSLMSWSLAVRLCFQGNIAIERLATSKPFPQLSRYCTEMAGRLAFKAFYKKPQRPAYSKDIVWRRPSVSRAKLIKNTDGRCGKTKYSSNVQA